jgi:hypothetical protein
VAAHLTTLDQAAAHQRLCYRAPRRHHAVRHGQDRASVTDPGYFPGGATGILYDRLAHFDIGPGDTFTARLEAIGYDFADVRTAVLSCVGFGWYEERAMGLRKGEVCGVGVLREC